MVDRLNSRKIFWNNTGLDIEFGASWGRWKTVKIASHAGAAELAGRAILCA
jgi:hypothetical protein